MSLPEGMKQKNVHLERLEIDGNHSLSFMTRGQLPSSLKQLRLKKCEKLQYVFGDADETHTSSYSVIHEENINTFLERLTVDSCPSLTCLSTRDQLPATLRYLQIDCCSKITTLSRGQLPDSLQDLFIHYCPKLEREEGLPSTNLRKFTIIDCENLKSLPRGMQTLASFSIWRYPSMSNIKSFPEECFHTKLTSLEIGIRNLDMYEQLIQWVLPKLTSLTSLGIGRCPDVESFEIGMMLPTSLTKLTSIVTSIVATLCI
ncbi:hypothetical protein EZV62_026130 [Acer yangbiense]|uniref:NB-ARC domain-containing protein n=1 Tax=Acer yangbiense TaxID=1000413 RepID=A0A5C7GNG3_9ROSI|nr:hypothetical protein EZV62_028154 [Acer yangbiense]TXG46836.1 hypothetical protein EZV62_026130 [Acer yangbiense]